MAELTPRQQEIRGTRSQIAAIKTRRRQVGPEGGAMTAAGGLLSQTRESERLESLQAKLATLTEQSPGDVESARRHARYESKSFGAPVEIVPAVEPGQAPIEVSSSLVPYRPYAVDDPDVLIPDVHEAALRAQTQKGQKVYRGDADPIGLSTQFAPMPPKVAPWRPMGMEEYKLLEQKVGTVEADERRQEQLGAAEKPRHAILTDITDERNRRLEKRGRLDSERKTVEAALKSRLAPVYDNEEGAQVREGLNQRLRALAQLTAENNAVISQLGRIEGTYVTPEEAEADEPVEGSPPAAPPKPVTRRVPSAVEAESEPEPARPSSAPPPKGAPVKGSGAFDY